MVPIFACRFLVYRCTDKIHIHLYPVLQELLPACSYHFGHGPGYIRVARRKLFSGPPWVFYFRIALYI